jgi:hypothetical protein
MARNRRSQGRTQDSARGITLGPLSSPAGVRIDDVFDISPGLPRLYAGHDGDGQGWLVALTVDRPECRRWLCAPASDQAIACVRLGRAQPADFFRHSATGSVEVVTADARGHVSEAVRLCTELADSDLPPRHWTSHPHPNAA